LSGHVIVRGVAYLIGEYAYGRPEHLNGDVRASSRNWSLAEVTRGEARSIRMKALTFSGQRQTA
jgi:hypothetical protein